jgi:hypothetical protein
MSPNTTPFFEAKAALLHKKFHRWNKKDQRDALDLRGESQENLLHVAGWLGGAEQIPPDLITPDLLTQTTRLGHSPTHLAAYHGHLPDFPAHALTEKTLLLKNPSGYQPLHLALDAARILPQYGPRHQKPEHYQTSVLLHLTKQLTHTVLVEPSPQGPSPLHLAICARATKALPKTLLTTSLLQCPNEFGETALCAIARTHQLDSLPENTPSPEEARKLLKELEISPQHHPWTPHKTWLTQLLKKATLKKTVLEQTHPWL